uniref:Cytochrome P450 n=1 Tax=Oryza brachyantha TaxID=4533 RepID=J3M7C0_ORYBR
MELSPLLLLLPFLLVGFFYLAAGGNTRRRRRAPAPRGLPIIGNLHQVGALPHRALRALAAANGAPHLLRLRLGQDEGRSELFRDLIEENATLLGGFCFGDYFPALAWADALLSGFAARARRNLRRWDDLLEKVIAEHEGKRRGRDDGSGKDDVEEDFVDVLLALQEEQQHGQGQAEGFHLTRDIIKSLLQDMFAAGTDTSFITLEWAMSELVKNPAAMRKLQDEGRQATPGGPPTRLPAAVVKETLRLHPPVPLLVPRECARDEDATVLGYHVDRGTRVFVNAWAIHRRPDAWSEPEDFRPERFLPGSRRGGGGGGGGHFQLVPFGAGRRVCPGMQFALATVELALASMVRLFDWEIPPPGELDMSDEPGFTVRRRIPLRLVAKPVG